MYHITSTATETHLCEGNEMPTKMVYVGIGFFMIYRLHVIYSDKVLFQCLLMLNVSYDVTQMVISGCLVHFR